MIYLCKECGSSVYISQTCPQVNCCNRIFKKYKKSIAQLTQK